MERRDILESGAFSPLFLGFDFEELNISDFFEEDSEEEGLEEARDEIEDIVDDLYDWDLVGKDEKEGLSDTVGECCDDFSKLKSFSDRDEEALQQAKSVQELPTELRAAITQVESILEIAADKFDLEIEASILSYIDEGAKIASMVFPLLAAGKVTVESGCTVHEDNAENPKQEREQKIRFLLNLTVLIAQVVLIQYSLSYKLAFRLTGKLNNKLLIHLRKVAGLEIYVMSIKGAHYAIRESITEAASYTLQQTKELDDNLNSLFEDGFDQGGFLESSDLELIEDWVEEIQKSEFSDFETWLEEEQEEWF